MRFDILTLFPEMFASPMGSSILKRGQQTGAFEIALSNIRDFTDNPHRKVDDKPYGGGPGMVMMCEPVFRCFEHVAQAGPKPGRVLLMTPQGRQYDQKMAEQLSREERVVIIAGRYEGFDERIREGLGAEQVSIGDYVLTGGELPAMVIVDSVARLLEGVLGDEDSAKDESFSNGLLEYPHYTRPENYRNMTVPEVLLSGHHKNIEKWRLEKSLERTKAVRPDLFEKYKDNSKYQENNREN
ncbi:tRNA (guanine-N(1)-)-methyltransferase [Sedimentisphaera cyanobacteriorum]|uniref:tRNA (guanine-N(1)-)-methyltransferase n=1 Tax=Sedimentisphaera cyanobacteriorum TaxID=1940790 RepID=A0A1Q2HM89_9BACT|nr:tRNA (guanosine(37)-N1)-methyltransferase TrmD [Sedimentisphaera cyanobacteriorum]AQQ08572.1 tRNA (guanine-N(1)-)-methyltransferase [Sedimentisphaera cyanobacteriorum]